MSVPGLTFHAEDHSYRLGNRRLAHITGVLAAIGLVSYAGVPAHRLTYARDRGSAAALAIRFVNERRLDLRSLSPELEPYLFAFESFCAVHHADFIPERVEEPFADPVLGFGGTPDVAGPLQGILSVVEVKCTAVVHAGHHVQTAAQKLLLRANGYPVEKRYVLQLRPDGEFRLHEGTDRMDEHVWRAALCVYQWKRREGLTS